MIRKKQAENKPDKYLTHYLVSDSDSTYFVVSLHDGGYYLTEKQHEASRYKNRKQAERIGVRVLGGGLYKITEI